MRPGPDVQVLDRMVCAQTPFLYCSKEHTLMLFICALPCLIIPCYNVSVAAVLVLGSACADLIHCHHSILCFIVNISIVLLSVFGVVGAYRNDGKLLGWFLFLILAFIGFEIGFLIWSESMRNIGAGDRGAFGSFTVFALAPVLCGAWVRSQDAVGELPCSQGSVEYSFDLPAARTWGRHRGSETPRRTSRGDCATARIAQ
jgi:hypothetical protein